MKREIFKEVVIVFLSIFLVLLFGCSEESSITDPVDEINPNLTKSLTAENGSFNIPQPIFKSLQKSFSTTKLVRADRNTTIRIKKDYESEAGPVKVDAKVLFKSGSLSEDTEVTMTFDTESGTISFSPYLNLEKDARFEFRFNCSGLPEIDEISLENKRLTRLSRLTIFKTEVNSY